MSKRMLAEVVSQLLDAGAGHEREFLAVLGKKSNDLEPLLDVIHLLRGVLVPVDPSARYVSALKYRLMTMSVEALPVEATPIKRIVIGALAFGSLASAVGAYLLISRARAVRTAA